MILLRLKIFHRKRIKRNFGNKKNSEEGKLLLFQLKSKKSLMEIAFVTFAVETTLFSRFQKRNKPPQELSQKIPATDFGNNSDCSKHPAHQNRAHSCHYFSRKKAHANCEIPVKQ